MNSVKTVLMGAVLFSILVGGSVSAMNAAFVSPETLRMVITK